MLSGEIALKNNHYYYYYLQGKLRVAVNGIKIDCIIFMSLKQTFIMLECMLC